jgi:uncharacterized membrane protein YgcG
MKRVLLGVCSALLAMTAVPTAHASVDDFTISNYDIKYELSQDGSGRSQLKTVETITAEFPSYDQNHGIERAIPKSYDGHPVSLDIQSVMKTDGTKWNYSSRTDNDNLVLRIGDANTYVHGTQTYVLTYSQRDVTKYFSDTNDDEFYWDTNGTQWKEPIDKLTVQLTIMGALKAKLNGKASCYQGYSGSKTPCELVGDGTSFETSASGLTIAQNVTIAIGFKPKTFAHYERSLWDTIVSYYQISLYLVGAAGVFVALWISRRWSNWSKRSNDVGTIIPEYTPPKDISVTTAATLTTPKGSVFTAQLLDFAVRGYLKIYQTKEKSLFKQAEYDIEIVQDIASLKAEEQEILRDIFGSNTAVGQRLALKTLKNNTNIYSRTLDNDGKLKQLVRGEYALRAKNDQQTRWFKRAALVIFILSIVLLNPALLAISAVVLIMSYLLWPLTDKGLELSRYLEGLKMYIKVAETDRIKMLQSPEGAQKIGGADPNDPAQLVKLYEKVLPYAVLFGQEKEWTKRIGDIYEAAGSQPGWYAGNNAIFNAAVFSSAMNGFTTSASYSSASSSSSGGSGGGGSSGGGGGGGGGGGW